MRRRDALRWIALPSTTSNPEHDDNVGAALLDAGRRALLAALRLS